MKKCNKIMLIIFAVLMVFIPFGCGNNQDAIAKKTIAEFLENKSVLYEMKEEIAKSLYNTQIGMDDLLWDLKKLLTEQAYDRLLANRYFTNEDILEGDFVKLQVKDRDYYKTFDDGEKIIFKVNYTEVLYLEDESKEERPVESEISLEKSDDQWLISYIHPFKYDFNVR